MELCRSLIEQSIDVAALSRDEWCTKFGHASLCHESDGDFGQFTFRGAGNKSVERKGLKESIRHWLDRLEKKKKRCDLSISSSAGRCLCNERGTKIKGCATGICMPQLYEVYAKKASAEPSISVVDTGGLDWVKNDLRGFLVEEASPHALAFYHRGVLFHGEVADDKYFQNNISSSSPCCRDREKEAMLACAAYLYFQLWWFRVVQSRDESSARGFTVSINEGKEVIVTLLVLQRPIATKDIAARYILYTYRRTYSCDATNSLFDLGRFVSSTDTFPNPFCRPHLAEHSPGAAMLLPGVCKFNNQQNDDRSRDPRTIPTSTGSLVICCSLSCIQQSLAEQDSDEGMRKVRLAIVEASTASNEANCFWYIKYKTPAAFGNFYDTAEVAINSTRRMLCQLMRKKTLNFEQRMAALHWLDMHPVDAVVSTSRSVTFVRDRGTPFQGPGQLSWLDVQGEFDALTQRTLFLQDLCHLVHGDIYHANVLFYSQGGRGSRLVLIDWDEALRTQPCLRKTVNEEEEARYPNRLVSFPIQYTKQQFLQLFQYYAQRYYPIESAKDESFLRFQEKYDSIYRDKGDSIGAVDARFKLMHDFLTS